MEYWKNLTVYTKELSESFVAVAVAIAAGKILHLILTFFSIHVDTATIIYLNPSNKTFVRHEKVYSFKFTNEFEPR